ncbi:hypothetical protein TEA_026223 [Camellia sinensis var. sinensis]|uniref:Uncharacterized protein n=1 Tax=Camellia sinensis var. sinensis TaxID=542762 RepID=A0A4S4EM22_CAMSN|nr:hypothetical protein TEA_026223 [Camellia sinensis var. sinensis]
MACNLIVVVVHHLRLLYSSLLMVARVILKGLVHLGLFRMHFGAALGYWMVRKFVIAEDGSVDVGIAQFVKWAMRVIAATFIFQVAIVFITLDTPLAMGALASCLSICFLITSFKWNGLESGMVGSRGTLWNSSRRSSGWSDSPVKVSELLYLLFILHGLVLTMILYDFSDNWEGDEKSTGLLFNIP